MGSSSSILNKETSSRDSWSKGVHQRVVLDDTSESEDDSDIDSDHSDEKEHYSENEEKKYEEDKMNENPNNFVNLMTLFSGRINIHQTNGTKLSKAKLFKDLNEAISKLREITNITNTVEHREQDLQENLRVIDETFSKFTNINPLPYDVVQSYQREAGRLLAKKKITSKMCSIVKEGLNMKNKDGFPDVQLTVKQALGILWNFSNSSKEVTYDIAKESDFLETLRGVLDSFVPERKKVAEMTPPELYLLQSILCIIHNTGMVEENIPRIKSLQIVKILSSYLESEKAQICLTALAILANIIDEKESQTLQKTPDAIRRLEIILEKALQSEFRQCEDDGVVWEAKECAFIVRRLAKNDGNKKLLVDLGFLPHLVKLLQEGTTEEHKVDYYEKRKGAETRNEKGHIMISYNKNHRHILITIKDELKRRGFRVWMDIEQMKGSTIDAMYDAVQSAHIVLMCMSQAYKDSDYCRLEALNAWKSKKTIIPLLMQKDYKADGWLDMILEMKRYYDFGDNDKYPFETMFENLLREINESYKKDNIDLSETYPTPASKWSITSVRKWKEDEVKKWFNQHGLPTKLSDRLTGRDLSALITMKKEAPESFYNLLQKNLKLNLATMDMFIEALGDLNG